MLQNLTNFFNLIKTKKIKTTLADNDLIAVGTRDFTWGGNYQPTAITFEDLQNQLGGITLTTNGLGTAADFSGGVLNIPVYQTQIPHLEWNYLFNTLWNNGKGDISTNTSFGDGALSGNTSGAYNTAIGTNALKVNSIGEDIVAIGYRALELNTVDYNTAIGGKSLAINTTGVDNTALGSYTLFTNGSGAYNTAIGTESLTNNTIGSRNTALGRRALGSNSTGNNNSAVGENTQSGNFNGSVILGKDATATANNQFVVGSSTTNAGAISLEAFNSLFYTRVWTVRINGANYKIPVQAI